MNTCSSKWASGARRFGRAVTRALSPRMIVLQPPPCSGLDRCPHAGEQCRYRCAETLENPDEYQPENAGYNAIFKRCDSAPVICQSVKKAVYVVQNESPSRINEPPKHSGKAWVTNQNTRASCIFYTIL